MSDMEITFCNAVADIERDSNDVVLCTASAERDGSDVVLCAGGDPMSSGDGSVDGDLDGLDCASGIGIYISGPDDCVDGSEYVAAGAIGMVGWFISCGSISASGVVSDIDGCCGSAVIVARDQCGQVATKTVRLPMGTWVLVSHIKYSINPPGVVSVTIGGKRKEVVHMEAWKRPTTDTPCEQAYDHDGCDYVITGLINSENVALIGLTCGDAYPVADGEKTGLVCLEIYDYYRYEWRCP